MLSIIIFDQQRYNIKQHQQHVQAYYGVSILNHICNVPFQPMQNSKRLRKTIIKHDIRLDVNLEAPDGQGDDSERRDKPAGGVDTSS